MAGGTDILFSKFAFTASLAATTGNDQMQMVMKNIQRIICRDVELLPLDTVNTAPAVDIGNNVFFMVSFILSGKLLF